MNTINPLLYTQSYISGAWQDAANKKTFKVIDPATGQVIADVADCDEQDAEKAIQSAHESFPSWSSKLASERAELLIAWYDLIMQHKQSLAYLMTLESGKPLLESEGEVAYCASFLQWYAAEGQRIYGDIIPPYAHNKQLLIQKKPVGVCAAITPWNFPLAMITRKCAPALAAGCTMILKPSKETPFSALALAALADQASIPKGVFNVVTSSNASSIGHLLSTHPRVRKLSFTGSTQVGKQLLANTADTIKRTSLELGGNAPFIIFEDADIDKAVEGAMLSRFRNAGQTCVCANRFLVHASIKETFTSKLLDKIKRLEVGNGLESSTTIGPLINEAAIKKVDHLVKLAVESGATCLLGGKRAHPTLPFYAPTLITDVTQNMTIAQTEIFGPVVTLISFENEKEAIKIANDTPFGLAAYFYTQNLSRTFRVASQLEYGIVGINEGIISSAVAPFGGVKASGLGREGGYQGIEEYVDTQYLCIGTNE